VLWENCGLHGQFAAPIARDVMVSYFNKKERIAEARKIGQSPASALANAIAPAAPPSAPESSPSSTSPPGLPPVITEVP